MKTLSDADRTKLTQDESTRKVDVVQARRNTLRACGEGFGQEYCEYNAVSKGNVVNAVKSAAKMGAADTVQCVFTSVHSDFQGTLGDPEKIADSFSTQLKPQLVSAERVPEGRVSAMKQGVNSRGAADTLISDCANLAKDTKLAKNAERQVQCYNLWVKSPSAAEKVRWEKACKSIDLSDDAAWAKSGVKEAALSDADRDLAACTMVLKAQHGGVSWRNSDPSICGRSYRAAHECNVTFKGIGEVAPQFPGFSMQGWTNRDTIPGCTSAKIGDAPSKNVVICNANPQDVKTYRAQKRPLQTLCRDKFGDQVAMQAPIGLLANLGDAKEETPFCKAFVAGAKHAQSPTPAGKQ